MTKQTPCRCERLDFPHRKDDKCKQLELQGDDLEAEFEVDRFNAEMRREFT